MGLEERTVSAVPGLEQSDQVQRGSRQAEEHAENSYHFQLALGDPADAVGSKVGVPGLDAAQAAEVLVTLFLPLRNQVFVGVSLLDAVLIELCRGADTITRSSQEVLEDSQSGLTSRSN